MSHARSNYNDQWVHIAIVRDSSTLRWFRNGVQVDTYNGSNWNWDMNSTNDLFFGLYPAPLMETMSVSIDNLISNYRADLILNMDQIND